MEETAAGPPQEDRVHLASDLHLGAPNRTDSLARERAFVSWMRGVVEGRFEGLHGPATELHLVGDLFDFWFDYRRAVPKGGVRLLGAIAEVVDAGIPVHYHVGNHDLWSFGYFEEELGVQLHREPHLFSYNAKNYLIGHGDGLGPGDYGYKRLKRVFTHPLMQWSFRWIHPDIGIRLASGLSSNSRAANAHADAQFHGPEGEWLWHYCKEQHPAAAHPIDAFIFGHRHMPLDLVVNGPLDSTRPQSRYVNLGDWIHHFTAMRIEATEAQLDQYRPTAHGVERVGSWRPPGKH